MNRTPLAQRYAEFLRQRGKRKGKLSITWFTEGDDSTPTYCHHAFYTTAGLFGPVVLHEYSGLQNDTPYAQSLYCCDWMTNRLRQLGAREAMRSIILPPQLPRPPVTALPHASTALTKKAA